MNEIPTIKPKGIDNISTNINGIPKIDIQGPSVIPTIDQPVLRQVEIPVTRGLALPVFQLKRPNCHGLWSLSISIGAISQ